MSQRLRPRTAAFNARPFADEGVSLYVTAGDAVVYRHLRTLRGGRRRSARVKGTAGKHDVAGGVTKTARREFEAGISGAVAFAWSIPAELADASVAVDVRHCRGDVEHPADNFRVRRLALDGGETTHAILGAAALRSVEPRAGGIVRIRFDYLKARDGIQPSRFRLTRTAGPTSPADVVFDWLGEWSVEIDTSALSDAAPYAYRLSAETADGTVAKVLLDAIAVQADATGPPAPSSGTAEAV